MNDNKIDVKDKEKINFLINYVIDNDFRADVNILHNAQIYPEYDDHDEIEKDYKRIVRFMSKYKMIDIIDDDGYFLATINNNTQVVKDLGINKYLEMFKKTNGINYLDNSINIGGNNKGNFIHSLNNSKSPLTHNAIAKTNKQVVKTLFIKVWKLLTENALISGLILFIILYAIKIYFNIEL